MTENKVRRKLTPKPSVISLKKEKRKRNQSRLFKQAKRELEKIGW